MASESSATDATARAEVDSLPAALTAFVREFGLHRTDVTPCGQPMSVSQAHALTALSDAGGLTQSQLGAVLHLTKSTVSRLVGQLEDRGWVERGRGSHDDGRVVELALTEAGSRLAAVVAEARRERLARLVERIPESEQAAVVRALRLLAEAASD